MKSDLTITRWGVVVAMLVMGVACGDPEPSSDDGMVQDMGVVADMPGEPEADPGLIARSGEVDSVPFGSGTTAVFFDGGLTLAMQATNPEVPVDVLDVQGRVEDAVALDEAGQSWLLVIDDALQVFDRTAQTLTPSIIADYLTEQRVEALAITRDDTGKQAIFIHTDAGLYVWRDEVLEKLEPTLHPTDMTTDGGDKLWVTTASQVMTLAFEEDALVRRMVFAEQGADQIVMVQGAMVMRQGEMLFTRAQDAVQWFEVVGVRAASIHGHPWAPDLWWRDVQGGTGHLYGDYMGEAGGVVIDEGAAVDSYGRLVTWNAAGEATRHDRVHRVIVPRQSEALTLPASLGVTVSFPDRLDRLEATIDGQPIDAAMPSMATQAASLQIPPSIGEGTHDLQVKAYYTGVSTPAIATTRLDAEMGDVTWDEHIEPIYKQYCASCHGVRNVYQLDSAESWQQARVPEGSSLGSFDYILSWVEPGNMPPGDLPKLTPAQITLLEQWRDQGFME